MLSSTSSVYSKSNRNPCFKRKHSHDRNQKIDNPPTEINKSSHIQCKTMSLTHFQRESWRKAESPCPIMLSENSVKDDSWFYTQYTHKYCSILMCSWSYRVVCSWLRDLALKKTSSWTTMINQTLWPINGCRIHRPSDGETALMLQQKLPVWFYYHQTEHRNVTRY